MIGLSDLTDEDKEVKRRKNEEYRAFLQLQIEEKERRLKAERRQLDRHPLGSKYETPLQPHRRNLELPSSSNGHFRTVLDAQHSYSSKEYEDLQKNIKTDSRQRNNGKAIFEGLRKNHNHMEINLVPEDVEDREILQNIYKKELRKQISAKKREREQQKRMEEEEDAKLEQKIREYHEEVSRREEKSRKDRMIKASRSVPEVVAYQKPRRVRNVHPETHLPKLNEVVKPSTPQIERYDPEITLAAKLNKDGKEWRNINSNLESTHKPHADFRYETAAKSKGTLPYISPDYFRNRIRSPPVPAVNRRIILDYDGEPMCLTTSNNCSLFHEVQKYYKGDRLAIERNLRNILHHESH